MKANTLRGTAVIGILCCCLCTVIQAGKPVKIPEHHWTYYSNTEIAYFARNSSKEHPRYCKLGNIGESIKGTPLWTMTIADHADRNMKLKPQYLYIGGIHGDEPLGRQFLVYLVQELCARSEDPKDAEMQHILANGVIQILFALNPDGFVAHARGNANNKDLNRDYPDPFKSKSLERTGKEQKETKLLMDYIAKLGESLVGLTTLHAGALVVNYPYDGVKNNKQRTNPSPDDKLFKYLAKVYADTVKVRSKEHPTGITMGAEWYPVYGGLQDWAYLHEKVYATTLELNERKWITEDQIEKWWGIHRPAMLKFVKAYITQGITFIAEKPVDYIPEDEGKPIATLRMLTEGYGRPTVLYSRKEGSAVHFPVPQGSYDIQLDWNDGDIQTQTVNVKSGQRTILKVSKPGRHLPTKATERPEDPPAVAEVKVEQVKVEQKGGQASLLPSQDAAAQVDRRSNDESNLKSSGIGSLQVLIVTLVLVCIWFLYQTVEKKKRGKRKSKSALPV